VRVIEIETLAVEPAELTPAGRRTMALALVVAGLVLTLTGPALVRPTYQAPLWQMDTSTRYFWLTDDTVYTVDVDRGVRLSARDSQTGRRRWDAQLFGPLADVYEARDVVLSANFPPSPADGLRTEVFDTNGGLVRLSFPVAALPIAYIGSSIVLTIDRDDSVAPQEDANAWIRARGLQWTYVATARDVRTGEVRWVRSLPAGVVWWLPGVRVGAVGLAGLPAGQEWMVTVSAAGEVEVWDLVTGHTLAQRGLDVASTDSWSYVSAAADVILVRAGRSTELAAYDPATLSRLWSFVPPEPYGEPVSCQPVLCFVTSTGVWLADPHSDGAGWRVAGPLLRPGSADRIVLTGYGARLVLADARTGRRIPVAAQWRMVDAGAYTRHVVVADVQSGLFARVALLDVASGRTRPVGQLSGWSAATSCLAAGALVACADGTRLLAWRVTG
jgi:hypothetical protein